MDRLIHKLYDTNGHLQGVEFLDSDTGVGKSLSALVPLLLNLLTLSIGEVIEFTPTLHRTVPNSKVTAHDGQHDCHNEPTKSEGVLEINRKEAMHRSVGPLPLSILRGYPPRG